MDENKCLNCGENIEKDYVVFVNGQEYIFDTFECAVNFLAPCCFNCKSIIMGHEVKRNGEIYCSETCAHSENYSMVVP